MTRQKRILVASSLTAGGEALAPVARRIQKTPNMRAYVLGYKAGLESFKARGISFDGKKQGNNLGLENVSPEICKKATIGRNPTSVLTGTQFQEKEGELTFEQMLWQVAKERGVKSIAVLDTWQNYVERFSDLEPLPDGNKLAIKRGTELKYLPDVIAVIDEFAKKEMLALGFPEAVLEVTGSPYFEHVVSDAGITPETRKQLLSKPVFSEFDKDGKLIVFISDSIERYYPDIGYTEKSVLQSFLKVMDEIAAPAGAKLNIVVRPHPNEERSKNAKDAFDIEAPNIVKVLHNPNSFPEVHPDKYSIEELLHSADLIVGTINNPLVTAKIMGKPVISYQPNLNEEKYDFQYYLHEQDLVKKVTGEDELGWTIIGLLNGYIFQETMEAARGTTDKIINLLK